MAFLKRELFSYPFKIRFLTKFILRASRLALPFIGPRAVGAGAIIYLHFPSFMLRNSNFRCPAGLLARGAARYFSKEVSFIPIDSPGLTGGQFSYYLAGLYEGDGYITVFDTPNKRQRNPLFAITFNIKDKPLAIKILSFFNLGHIANRKGNSIEMRITSVKDLIILVNLINGKLRTPKIDQLYNLIDWLNHNHSCSIPKLQLDNSPISSNAWLAGFFDADSNFFIQISPTQIICKFAIEQRILYPKTNQSFENSLLQITSFLEVKLSTRYRISIDKHYFILRVESQHSSKLLVNYLDKFCLFSSKYLDFLSWKRALSLILTKKHTTDKGKKIIANLKNNLNNKRTKFNWEHLNNIFSPPYLSHKD
jgi:hypothetical protein